MNAPSKRKPRKEPVDHAVSVILRDGARIQLVAATFEVTPEFIHFYSSGQIGPVAIFDRCHTAGFTALPARSPKSPPKPR